jgi:hypothetical protein
MPARLTRLDLKSRYEIECGRSADAGDRRDSYGPNALGGAQLQPLRGTVCPIDQGRMLGPAGGPRRGASSSHARRVQRALSLGAESPGPAGAADYAGTDGTAARCDPLPPAARFTADSSKPIDKRWRRQQPVDNSTRHRGRESPDQNIASGFTISPVLPGTSGGATTSRNSHWLRRAAVSARRSSRGPSSSWRPIATSATR